MSVWTAPSALAPHSQSRNGEFSIEPYNLLAFRIMPTSFGSDDDGGADVVFFIWHFQFDKLRELSPHNREPLARATYQNTHTKCTAFILVHNKFNELNQIGNVALRETKKMRTKKSRRKIRWKNQATRVLLLLFLLVVVRSRRDRFASKHQFNLFDWTYFIYFFVKVHL